MELTSADNVRSFAGLTVSDIADTDLDALVTRASAIIRGYCSRDITAEGLYSETFDGAGGVTYVPQQWPLTAVQALTIDGVSIPMAGTQTAPGYIATAGKVSLRGYRFTGGTQNCTLVYEAGEASPPPDVEHAAILTVMEAINARCRDPSVRSESVNKGLYQATYLPMAIPEQAKAILNQTPYVRRHW